MTGDMYDKESGIFLIFFKPVLVPLPLEIKYSSEVINFEAQTESQ